MHEKEILYFTESFELLKNNFYVDAVQRLESLLREFPDSDLADDAEYNRALCYYEMNYFEKSKEILMSLIENYPEATISALSNSNEFGKTAAKAYYLIINCCLALKQIDEAIALLHELKAYIDTYIIKDGVKTSFYELSTKAIEIYKSLTTFNSKEEHHD